jgi:hypothetical protein
MAAIVLQDHFSPPLSLRRHWHAFHNAWATYMASELNAVLPEGYFAEPNVQFGIEIDVATFEDKSSSGSGERGLSTWVPPPPVMTIPFALATDAVEVLLYENRAGPTLAGAIELVSPANKDRATHREAFVSKCETYLQAGAGVLIVDVVTDRHASLHTDLLTRLNSSNTGSDARLYVAAYRPIGRDGKSTLDVWHEPLNIGGILPTMPLSLRGKLCLPVNLAASYERTCRELKIPR